MPVWIKLVLILGMFFSIIEVINGYNAMFAKPVDLTEREAFKREMAEQRALSRKRRGLPELKETENSKKVAAFSDQVEKNRDDLKEFNRIYTILIGLFGTVFLLGAASLLRMRKWAVSLLYFAIGARILAKVFYVILLFVIFWPMAISVGQVSFMSVMIDILFFISVAVGAKRAFALPKA